MTDKISELILDEFSIVGCFNCGYTKGSEECELCDGDLVEWGISKDRAERLSNKILQLVKTLELKNEN